MEWKPITVEKMRGGPLVVGWAGSPTVCRAIHDGNDWFVLLPDPDEPALHGFAKRIRQAPTHYLSGGSYHAIWNLEKQTSTRDVAGQEPGII